MKYIIIMLLLISCQKEIHQRVHVCGIVWDKGHDSRGYYLIVDDRTIYVTYDIWTTTSTNSIYCQ